MEALKFMSHLIKRATIDPGRVCRDSSVTLLTKRDLVGGVHIFKCHTKTKRATTDLSPKCRECESVTLIKRELVGGVYVENLSATLKKGNHRSNSHM